MKKNLLAPVSLLAGSAVLTVISCAAAPFVLKAGLKALRRKAEEYCYDPQTGTIRRKDENVVILNEDDYHIE